MSGSRLKREEGFLIRKSLVGPVVVLHFPCLLNHSCLLEHSQCSLLEVLVEGSVAGVQRAVVNFEVFAETLQKRNTHTYINHKYIF